MTRRPPKRTVLKQPLAPELVDSLLAFLEARFYPGHHVAFTKDRKRLFAWCIVAPSSWLQRRGVTLPPDRFRSLIQSVLLDALAHARAPIKYLPGWLKNVLEKHFDHHGDEIYEEAKAIRTQIDRVMLTTGHRPTPTPDPIAQIAATASILTIAKGKKPSPKRVVNDQLTLI